LNNDLQIVFDGSIGCRKEGIDTLIQPWFETDGILPFPIPQDPETSDVFFYALYNPDAEKPMKYVCYVEDDEGERTHEFDLTEQEIAILKEGMEKLCQEDIKCDLLTYWRKRGEYI